MTSISPDTGRPAEILRLSSSFCDARALMTAVELGLFTLLHEAPATEEEIRERLGLHGRGLSHWLDLLVELNLLGGEDGRYRNSPDADRFLVQGAQSYVGGFVQRSGRNLYPAWGRLTEALRTGDQQSGSSFEAVLDNPAVLRQFVASMDSLTSVLGGRLIESYDGWTGHGSVLDVGGCRGNVASMIVSAHPHLSGAVFDLPQMSPFFDEMVAERGQAGRLTFHGGSFFTDPLPSADIVVLGHVLHDWDREQRRFLVEKAYDSVNPGGVLVVYDRMLERESSRLENLVISLDMTLLTDGGSEYTVAELREHAEKAGFGPIEDRPLGDYDTVVICHKAA